MDKKPYDIAVFIGRFQPFHNGHLKVLKKAFEVADRVLVLVGSSNRARDTRNPFTFTERLDMIRIGSTELSKDGSDRRFYSDCLVIKPLADGADAAWIRDVQQAVKDTAWGAIAPKVTLIGHERDETSAYLKWFPQWDYTPVADGDGINATDIREVVFGANAGVESVAGRLIKNGVSGAVTNWLCSFRDTKAWWELKYERAAEVAYRSEWGDKEPHLTADAVVMQSGHVLMIRRGNYPGKGMLALPGGFKERGETLFQSACRELREETLIDLSDEVLTRSLYGSDVFDDPQRSRRGEIVTRAFFFKLPDGPLPSVKGADDAAEACWVPLNEIRVDATFEDHAFIIEKAIAQLERQV